MTGRVHFTNVVGRRTDTSMPQATQQAPPDPWQLPGGDPWARVNHITRGHNAVIPSRSRWTRAPNISRAPAPLLPQETSERSIHDQTQDAARAALFEVRSRLEALERERGVAPTHPLEPAIPTLVSGSLTELRRLWFQQHPGPLAPTPAPTETNILTGPIQGIGLQQQGETAAPAPGTLNTFYFPFSPAIHELSSAAITGNTTTDRYPSRSVCANSTINILRRRIHGTYII